mmetsp:Transcript_35003/g.88182  ORF Transcript_35003/g.88182 Transcript_35003/m.88182 type:complete len:234 (-) Transcript_35003:656-1357(-)
MAQRLPLDRPSLDPGRAQAADHASDRVAGVRRNQILPTFGLNRLGAERVPGVFGEAESGTCTTLKVQENTEKAGPSPDGGVKAASWRDGWRIIRRTRCGILPCVSDRRCPFTAIQSRRKLWDGVFDWFIIFALSFCLLLQQCDCVRPRVGKPLLLARPLPSWRPDAKLGSDSQRCQQLREHQLLIAAASDAFYEKCCECIPRVAVLKGTTAGTWVLVAFRARGQCGGQIGAAQ